MRLSTSVPPADDGLDHRHLGLRRPVVTEVGVEHRGVVADLGGRAPTEGETATWLGLLSTTSTVAGMRGAILDDPLGQHATDVIQLHYRDYFGRAASEGEVAVWRGAFRAGTATDTLLDTLFTHPDARGVTHATGTAGADSFRLGDSAHLQVDGFDPLHDRIDLSRSVGAGSDPLAHAREVFSLDGRTDVLIDGVGYEVLLTGVHLSQLSAGDFVA